jgi:hypothetical protein
MIKLLDYMSGLLLRIFPFNRRPLSYLVKKYGRLRLVERLNRGALVKAIGNEEQILGRHPLNVQIQTTSVCNGGCIICPYRGSWHQKNPGCMSEDTYRRIIHGLKEFKVKKFCPYLENEPLADRSIFERIDYAVSNLDIEWVEMSTNLALLDGDMLMKIKELFPRIRHEIWVSFHGASRQTYEEIMGINYERVLANVLSLVELAQEVPLKIALRGAGFPRLDGGTHKKWFTKEEYVRFWDNHLSGFKKRPVVTYFTYHDRAGAKQLKERDMSFNVSGRDLNNFYCPRFDQWVHFLYTGQPILCCMDYNRETALDGSINDCSMKELYGSAQFIDLIRKGAGLAASGSDFMCKRCISPGG